MNTSSEQRADRLILAAITLAAAWLRFHAIGQPSLWWDEFITLGASIPPLPHMLAVLKYIGPSDIGEEMFPPLQHVITHFLMAFAHSDVLMRLPGVLAGIAAIPAVFLLCRHPLGRLTAHAAALGLALSVYHIHFSREVRPYSLFMLENILALHLLYTALLRDRRKLLAGWSVCVAAMLYTSYMAATLVFAQTLFAGYWLLREYLGGRRKWAKAFAWSFGLAMLCSGLVYLPWAEGQINIFRGLHDPNFKPPFTWDFIASSFKEFAAFAYRGEFPTGMTLAGLALVGFVLALRRRQTRDIAFLAALWAFMPIVGIFLAKARMELSSRYLFTVYYFLIIFGAHALARAVEAAADRFGGGSQPIHVARVILVGSLVLYMSGPNLMSLRGYYSRETSHYKELVSYLIEHRDNHDEVVFFHPRNLTLVYDWYGADTLPAEREISGGGYHRAFLLAPCSVKAREHFPLAVMRATFQDADILSLGVARTPVRPMIPDARGNFVYSEDFSSYKILEDVHAASNMAPSPVKKTLIPRDAGLPGWCVYRFQVPGGLRLDGAKLTLTFSNQEQPGLVPDARDSVTVIAEGKPPVTLHTVTVNSFRGPDGKFTPVNHEWKRFVTLSSDLTKELEGATSFDLRLDYGEATCANPIELENFKVEARLSGPVPDPEELPGALLDQLPVARWTPGEDMALSYALHAFSLDGKTARPTVGTPSDLNAYLLSHPGDKPVRVLNHPDGSPAVALYDPALRNPYLSLAPGPGRRLTALPTTPRTVRSFKLKGQLACPTLGVGRLSLPLPVACPAPSELIVNPDGRAQVDFSPLFTKGEMDFEAMADKENIRKNDDEDCLTCAEDRPCHLTYAVRSALPVTGLYLTAFPRVYCDAAGKSALRTLISTDGVSWREVNAFTSSGSGLWEGWKIPQYSRVDLDVPASQVLVRFELSGQKAQLWSAPDARMRIKASLDASRLPVPDIDSWPARLSVANDTPLEVFVSDQPQSFPDRLERTR